MRIKPSIFCLLIGLMGCSSSTDLPPPLNLDKPDGGFEPPPFERTPKDQLGSEPHCATWRTDLAPHFDPPPWGLPESGVVSENVQGFFAAQYLIGGVDYMGCVLYDIFAEIELNVETLRDVYFAMPPEAQYARSQVPIFLLFLYEEPLVLELLIEIAVQPTPTFDPEYVEYFGMISINELESAVRTSAVQAIIRTTPSKALNRQPWMEALFTVVMEAESEFLGEKLQAMRHLRNSGVPKEEFFSRVSDHLDEDELTFLLDLW